ncbi:MAG: 50S ribosomal protein L29 [Planctomycetes bacterium]|nr:50S ribosomal protein L29 [Planctomycetota bacterium]
MNKALTEIRGEDTRALQSRLADLRKEQFDLRFHAADEGTVMTSRNREIRRTIARILTVIGERQRAGGDQK